jgi:hypothetical protein
VVGDGIIACYSCSYGSGITDESCLNNLLSQKVAVVACPSDTSECTVKSMRTNSQCLEFYVSDSGMIFFVDLSHGRSVPLAFGVRNFVEFTAIQLSVVTV